MGANYFFSRRNQRFLIQYNYNYNFTLKMTATCSSEMLAPVNLSTRDQNNSVYRHQNGNFKLHRGFMMYPLNFSKRKLINFVDKRGGMSG
jgi:hypothetical protein